MSLRRAIVEMDVTGVNVAAFCRDHSVSRDRFYTIRRRYEAEGEAGLAPRSRAPHTVAKRTPLMVDRRLLGPASRPIVRQVVPGFEPPEGEESFSDILGQSAAQVPGVGHLMQQVVVKGRVGVEAYDERGEGEAGSLVSGGRPPEQRFFRRRAALHDDGGRLRQGRFDSGDVGHGRSAHGQEQQQAESQAIVWCGVHDRTVSRRR
jgi:hypothetical protein